MKKFFTHLIQLLLVVSVLLQAESIFAQCPTFPSGTDNWGSFQRIHYNGNWLLNANGTNYASSPPPNRTPNITGNHVGFGLNDYETDTNFSSIAPPSGLTDSSPIIRVGDKTLGNGSNVSQSAQIASFTFIPLENNCKLRVHYIGFSQVSTNLIDNNNNLRTASINFRQSATASFGLFCNYENYNSNIINNWTNDSKSGRAEFGKNSFSIDQNPPVSNNNQLQEYGLNDMFSFVKKGSSLNIEPSTLNLGIRKHNNWQFYDLDFSEFIGQEVTIYLFANTSMNDGTTELRAYAYYIFECLDTPNTTLPESLLVDRITGDENQIHEHLGCVNLPHNVITNITDVLPTLLGNTADITTNNPNANYNKALKWLRLIGVDGEEYRNNFASLELELFNQSTGNWDAYTNFRHANGTSIFDDIQITLTNNNYTEILAQSTTAPETYVYRFRAIYRTKENINSTNPQIQEFEYRLSTATADPCDFASTGSFTINPPIALDHYQNLEYLICKPLEDNNPNLMVFSIELPGSDCSTINQEGNASVLKAYKWQYKSSTGGWIDITNSNSLNLSDAQKYVFHNSCKTDFRRLTISSIPCEEGTEINDEGQEVPILSNSVSVTAVISSEILTIWNQAFIPHATSSILTKDPFEPNVNNSTVNNLPICDTKTICWGDKLDFSCTLFIGNTDDAPQASIESNCIKINSCNGPNLQDVTNMVKGYLYIIKDGVEFPLIDTSFGFYYTGYSFSPEVPINFSYTAFPDNFMETYYNGTPLDNYGGFSMYGNVGAQQVKIYLKIITTFNSCESIEHILEYTTLSILPRGIGGNIIDPDCPLEVLNNGNVYTTGYDTLPGDPVNGYIWEYSTTPTGPWTTIGGQGDVNLPLWTMAVFGVNRTFYIRRVAKPGDNCGGTEPSNVIKIETPDNLVVPTFNLPPSNQTICRQVGFQQLQTTSNNGITGTWHVYSTPSIGGVITPTIGEAINPSRYNTNIAGTFRFIFIPSTTNTVCSDFYIHNVTIINPITPTTNVAQSYCETTLPFNLPVISTNNRPIVWEVLNETTGNYQPIPNNQWSPNLYTTPLDNPANTNGIGVLTFRFSLDPNPLATNYYQCGVPVTRNIRLNRTINFTTPTTLSYCVGQTTGILQLPTQQNIIGGQWKRGATVVTSISTTTAGTFTYTYTGTNTCTVHPPIVVTILPKLQPSFTQIPPICRGASFTLPTTSNNSITGTWSPAINNLATTTYTFTPASGQCVTSTNTTMTVVVNPIVTPTFDPSLFYTICQGDTMIPLPTTSINGITGTWSPLNNQTTTTYVFTPTAGLCARSITRTIIVKPVITPVFDNLVTSYCIGNPTFALPTNSLNNISGTWSPATINNTTAGSYDYTFTPTVILANNQCANPITITIETTECVPILTWEGEVGCEESGDSKEINEFISDEPCIKVCENSSITYTIFGNNAAITSTEWIVTNGTITSQTNTSCTVQWDDAAYGFIQANISYANGLGYYLNRCVQKVNAPTALFSIGPFQPQANLVGCVNNSICFTNLSTPNDGNGELYYNWTFTNMNTNETVTSSEFQPCHTFTEEGNYLVTLTVFNGCSCVATYYDKISIKKAEFELKCFGAVCEGAIEKYEILNSCNAIINISGGTLLEQYENSIVVHWNNLDNNPSVSGFGSIVVATPDCSPCTLTYTIPIIETNGTITGKDNLCVGEQYTYTLPQWASTDFQWSIVDPDNIGVVLIQTHDRNEIVVQSYNSGTITLVANYTHSILQCSGTASFDIHISPTVTIDPLDPICINTTQEYYILDEEGNQIEDNFPYFITGPNGYYQTGNNPTIVFAANATGTYFVTPIGDSYCSDGPLQIIVNNSIPAPTNIMGNTSICPGIQYTYSVAPQQGASVVWTVQGGTIQGNANGNEITVIFNPNVTSYSITAKYVKEFCESLPFSKSIFPIIPNVAFSPPTDTTNLTTVCRSTIVTYSITTTDILDFIEWEVSPQFGSIVSGQNSTTVSISWNNIGGTTPLKVKVRRCNIEHQIQQNITINQFPNVTMQFDTPVCTTPPTTFSIVGLTSFTSINWNFGDGTTEVSSSETILHGFNDPINGSMPYTVTAVIQNPNGCPVPLIVSQNITVSPSPVITLLPVADLYYNFNPANTNGTYTVNIQSGVAETQSIRWFKNGNVQVGTGAIFTFTPGDSNAIGTYYAEVTNSFGCIARTNLFRVYDNDDNIVTDPSECEQVYTGILSASVSNCNQLQVNYIPEGTPESSKIIINGATYNTTSLNLNFNEPGAYPVTALSTYPDGCSSANTTSFLIPYIADLKYTVQCNGATSTLTVSDFSRFYPLTPIDEYGFNINGGAWVNGTLNSANIHQAVFNLLPGTHTIGIRIRNSMDYDDYCYKYETLQIFPAPDASFTMSQTGQVCAGVPITLTPTTIVPNNTYLWTFRNGDVDTQNSSPNSFVTFQNVTSGIVRLTVTNPNGCSSTTTQIINVNNSKVNAKLVQLTTPVCDGNPVTLGWTTNIDSPPNPDPTNLKWYFQNQDENELIGSGLTIEVTEPGYYFAYAENQYGCEEITQFIAPVFVEILPAQAPIFEIPATVCLGTTIEPSVDTDATSYTWFVNGEEVLTENTPNFTFDATEPGNYTIGLQVGYTTGAITCTSPVTEHEVSVVAAPITPILQVSSVQCEPYLAQIAITNPQAGISYYWSNGQTGTVATSTHDGPIRVRAEINDCTTSAQLTLPKDLNTLQWSMLTGCYTSCQSDPAPQLLGPSLPQDIAWQWIVNGSPVDNGQGNVTPLTLQSEPADYQLVVNNGVCEELFGTANIGVQNCQECDIIISSVSMECIIVNGVRQITYHLIAYNNSNQPLTVSLTPSVGMLMNPAITFPVGSTPFTLVLLVGQEVTQDIVYIDYIGYGGPEVCIGKIKLQLTDDCSLGRIGRPELIKVLMMPNPTTASVQIQFEATEQAPVTIQIADGLGRVLFSEEHPTGTGTFVFDATKYAAGYYPIQIRQKGIVIYNNKIIKK